MTTVQQIYEEMQRIAPLALAESWDNPGLLVDCGGEVSRVLVTLDITPEVVEEAARKGCGLIVSHHPVIFSPLKKLGGQDVAFQLVKNGISAICMHTNLDAAPGGVNDTLCDILGIAAEGRESFAEGCGRIGTTMPTTPSGWRWMKARAGRKCQGVGTLRGRIQRAKWASVCASKARSRKKSATSVSRAERIPKSACTAAANTGACCSSKVRNRSKRSRRTSRGTSMCARLAWY